MGLVVNFIPDRQTCRSSFFFLFSFFSTVFYTVPNSGGRRKKTDRAQLNT
ncbi:hypothetical protein NDI43_17230 [Microcoleus vaginatus GB2-A3]